MFVSYFGIRVTDLERSTEFYTRLFGLMVVRRGDNSKNGGGKYVLLRDQQSGQRLELNWYPETSRYSTAYEPGEGLDHIGVKVESVPDKIKELAAKGVEVVTVPDSIAEPDLGSTFTIHVGFVKDPDGNWIGLYDHSGPVGKYNPNLY